MTSNPSEADARGAPASLKRRLHQAPPDALPLSATVDRYRSEPADRAALIDEVGPHDLAIALGDDAPDQGMRDECAGELVGGLERREVALEAMVVVDGAERLVDDARTLLGVGGRDRSELDCRIAFGRSRFADRGHCPLLLIA